MDAERELELSETLTAKQIRFCQEYMVDLNGTQAATRAGYSEDSANVISSQLLTKLNIREYVAELQKDAANSLKITKEKILSGGKMLSFYDIRNMFNENGNLKPIEDLDDTTAFAITSFEVEEQKYKITGDSDSIVTTQVKKVKFADRRGSLDLLNKMLGYYAPQVIQADITSKGESFVSAINILPPGSENIEIKENE